MWGRFPRAVSRTSGIRWVSGSCASPSLALRVGAGGVEVAQVHVPQAVGPAEVRQDLLDHPLAAAVGVDRRLGVFLPDRGLAGFPVRGATRREDQVLALHLDHGLEERQGAGHVVAVVRGGLPHRLAHVGVRGEVQDGADAVLQQDLPHALPVRQVRLDEGAPPRGPPVPAGEVVEHDRVVPLRSQELGGVASDVTGAAGNEDGFVHGEGVTGDG